MAKKKSGQVAAQGKMWMAEQADKLNYHRAGKKWARALFAFRGAAAPGTIEAALKDGPLTVSEVVKMSGGRSQPEVSTRLKNLYKFGLLKRQAVGRLVMYELNQDAFAKMVNLGQWLAIEAQSCRDARQYSYLVAHAFADSLTALLMHEVWVNDFAIEKEQAEKWAAKPSEVKYALEKLALLGLVEKRDGEAVKESPSPDKPRGARWGSTEQAGKVVSAFVTGCAALG